MKEIVKNGLKFLVPDTYNRYIIKKGPSYKIRVALAVHRELKASALQQLMILSKIADPEVQMYIKAGDALIDRTRSIIASKFIQEMNEDMLVFLDDDILYTVEDVMKICNAIHTYKDCDIVGGAYMAKCEKEKFFVVKLLNSNDEVIFGEGGGLREVEMVSTGFMAIRRKVIEEIAKTMPLCHPDDLKFWPMFQPYPKEIHGKWVYLSEDWAFCDRARALGFKVWCDTTIKLGHQGSKVYSWDEFFLTQEKTPPSFGWSGHVIPVDKLPEARSGLYGGQDHDKPGN